MAVRDAAPAGCVPILSKTFSSQLFAISTRKLVTDIWVLGDAQSATIQSPLAISVLWCVYQMIPSGLVLLYACISKGMLLQYACRLGIILSFFTGACAVGLMWGLYPPNYDFASVAKMSTFYYDAQRVGDLPAANQVSWRGDALIGQTGPLDRDMTGERPYVHVHICLHAPLHVCLSVHGNGHVPALILAGNRTHLHAKFRTYHTCPTQNDDRDQISLRPAGDCIVPSCAWSTLSACSHTLSACQLCKQLLCHAGGWLTGGAAGNTQLTMPTAFTVAMLSWGLLAFPEGYQTAGATSEALAGIKWGADWLVKAVGEGTNGTSNTSTIVYQMGNWTTDQLVCGPMPHLCSGPDMKLCIPHRS